MNRELNIVVPAKDPEGAKQRLDPVLSPEQRTELAICLLETVLRFLSENGAQFHLLVVTDSKRISSLARKFRATVLKEDRAEGETTAVNRATRWSLDHGFRSQLVLPGDMATLDPVDFARLLEAPRNSPSLILCPATDDDGTNAILATPPDVVAYRFGVKSFPDYCEKARKLGIEPTILRLPSLVLDLDTPGDLKRFLEHHPHHPAWNLLHTWHTPRKL